MPSSLALLFFFSTSVFAMELKCTDGQIRWYHEKKQSQEIINYCTNDDGTVFVSKDCYLTQCWKKFNITQLALDKAIDQEIGSPGFAICRALKGVPQIIEFEHQKRWVSLDRCRLKEGDIDTGLLFKVLNEKVKTSR